MSLNSVSITNIGNTKGVFMSIIQELLSPEELNAVTDKKLTRYEKLILALSFINKRNPDSIFTYADIAVFLYNDPKKVRGIHPMLESIKARWVKFPIEMVERAKNDKEIRGHILYNYQEIFDSQDPVVNETNL